MHFIYSKEMQSCLTHTRVDGSGMPTPYPRGKRSQWGKIFLWFYFQWVHLKENQTRWQLQKTHFLELLPNRMLYRLKILNWLRLFLQILWTCYTAWDSNIWGHLSLAFFCIKQEWRNLTVFQGLVSEPPESWICIQPLLIIIITS